MIKKPVTFYPKSGKKSTGTALLFAIIMIMGMLLIFKNPPGSRRAKPRPNTSQNIQETNQYQTNYGWYFFRMVAVTGFVITLFVVGAKWYQKKMTLKGNHFSMQILGKQYISSKQYLMMVRVENKKMLLGVTDQSINLVKEFDSDIDEDDFQLDDEDNGDDLQKRINRDISS